MLLLFPPVMKCSAFFSYSPIFLAVCAATGVSHKELVHKQSIKGVFYCEDWCTPATPVMLLILLRACVSLCARAGCADEKSLCNQLHSHSFAIVTIALD